MAYYPETNKMKAEVECSQTSRTVITHAVVPMSGGLLKVMKHQDRKRTRHL